MFKSRLNCKVMMELPNELVEVIWFRPGIWPNWRSSGAVTAEAGPDGMVSVATAHGTLRCPFAQAVRIGQKVVVTARPEDLMLYSEAPGEGLNAIAGTVSGRIFLGDVIDYVVDVGEAELRIRARPEHAFRVSQSVHIGVAPQKCVGLPS